MTWPGMTALNLKIGPPHEIVAVMPQVEVTDLLFLKRNIGVGVFVVYVIVLDRSFRNVISNLNPEILIWK